MNLKQLGRKWPDHVIVMEGSGRRLFAIPIEYKNMLLAKGCVNVCRATSPDNLDVLLKRENA